MNKFEQISRDDHQMPVVGKGLGTQFQVPWPGVRGRGKGVGTQVPCLARG